MDAPNTPAGKPRQDPQTLHHTAQDYPRDVCVHQLFTQQALRTPHASALCGSEGHCTYGELDALSNRLARLLQQRHAVQPETVVGCHLSRSENVLVCVLSVLKAGGAYLLLDPTLPDERLRHMVQDAQPVVILTDASMAELPAAEETPTLALHTAIAQAAPLPAGPVASAVRPGNAAYIAYTSGSTGRPKGVIVHHQAVVNHAFAFSRLFALTPQDRIPLMASITFDIAVEEMIPPLIAGCTLVPSRENHASMPAFHREIVQQRYTILNIPAPMWHEWVQYLRDTRQPVPGSLRLVIVGSDKIHTRCWHEWKTLPGAASVQWVAAYGTTETTITSSFYLGAWDDDLRGEPCMPIGRPIANTGLYILDEDGRPVAPGETGELFIAGDGVARGYHRRPEETLARFVPDPFAGSAGARMYRTGDLARRRPDGNVVWLGRKDHQVKINGLRVELPEIEAALMEHPDVNEAVAVFRQPSSDGGGASLIAFVSCHPGRRPAPQTLIAFLRTRLHRHMVPQALSIFDALPRNANGKVDRKALEQAACQSRVKAPETMLG